MKLFALILAFFSLSFTEGPKEQKVRVYVFVAEECPICNFIGKPMARLANEYNGQAEFYAVFPNKMSNYKTIFKFKKKYGMEAFLSILDEDQSTTKKYGATVTPEVVVVDQDDNILYKGRFNNSYYAPGKINHTGKKQDLKEALNLILAGNSIPQPWPKAIGCFITIKK